MTIERITGEMPAAVVGGKASHVGWLIARNERVPPTWVVAPTVPIDDGELADTFDAGTRYAVRSSATIEDGDIASYAGQFATELDVAVTDLAVAIDRVRRSGQSERVATYQDHIGSFEEFDVAVMVQPMVEPVASGVAFSRNPMTGLNEVVIEVVAGSGEQLMGEGKTPDRWVRRWGTWTEKPDHGVIPDAAVAEIAGTAVRLSTMFGRPVDLEWVWDGQQVWLVQMRPITGIDDIPIYSNRISREVLPGMIKPLVWSVNVPMVNQAWVNLFTEAIGPNDIQARGLARSFCYRAYFNMGAIGEIFELMGMPRDSLELLLGLPAGEDKPSFKPSSRTMRLLPRMLGMGLRKARYGKAIPKELHSLQAAYSSLEKVDLAARSDSALLSDIAALTEIGIQAAYANIVTPLLANIHNALLRRRLTAAGLDPESVAIGDTKEMIGVNPNLHLEELGAGLARLDEETRQDIRERGAAALPDSMRPSFDDFMVRFGHLSASGNDFSVPTWRETPRSVLTMALDHTNVHGETTQLDWAEAESQLSALQRPLLRKLRNRTQEFIAHRENVSFTYTYGYGLFRRFFLEVGRRLVDRGVLSAADDVMYLYIDEVRAALLGMPVDPPGELVAARRREMEDLHDVDMPEIIYGDDYVPVQHLQGSTERTGIPTSRGHHRGTLRVVRDTSEFQKVMPGDVIAIPYSDVAWTPLFARAGAVVAESGGMLSHSSIVAREYRIPCVVSVAGATKLPDGATVVVDGYAGSVVVEDG